MEKIKINDEIEILILNDKNKFLELIPENEKKEVLELTDLNNPIYLKKFENLFFVFLYKNEFLGFILIDIPREIKNARKNIFVFFDYYISPKFRGKGFSKILINLFLEKIISEFFKNKILVNKNSKFCIKASVEKNNEVSKKIISEKLKMRPYLNLKNEIRFIRCF
jgi:RimJ/RimL family protein N-acetyltransferase